MKSAYTHYSEYGIGETLIKSPYTHYLEDCQVVNTRHEILALYTGFVYVWLDHTCAFRGTFKARGHFSFSDDFTSELLAVPRFGDDSQPSYFVYVKASI